MCDYMMLVKWTNDIGKIYSDFLDLMRGVGQPRNRKLTVSYTRYAS